MLEERKSVAEKASSKTWETNFVGSVRDWVGLSSTKQGSLGLQDILSQKSFENFNDLGDPETWIKAVWKDTSADASAWQ
jgi:hypothetical protein